MPNETGSSADIMALLRQIDGKVTATQADVSGLRADTEEFKRKFACQDKRLDNLEKSVEHLKTKASSTKPLAREKNLIFYNIEDSPDNNKNLVVTVNNLFQSCEINIPVSCIERAFRMGKSPGKRPVLVSFAASNWKGEIFVNAQKLRDIQITFARDLSKHDRVARNELVGVYKQLKNDSRNVKMLGNKITLDGKDYTLEQLRSSKETSITRIINKEEAVQLNDTIGNISNGNSSRPLNDNNSAGRGASPKLDEDESVPLSDQREKDNSRRQKKTKTPSKKNNTGPVSVKNFLLAPSTTPFRHTRASAKAKASQSGDEELQSE